MSVRISTVASLARGWIWRRIVSHLQDRLPPHPNVSQCKEAGRAEQESQPNEVWRLRSLVRCHRQPHRKVSRYDCCNEVVAYELPAQPPMTVGSASSADMRVYSWGQTPLTGSNGSSVQRREFNQPMDGVVYGAAGPKLEKLFFVRASRFVFIRKSLVTPSVCTFVRYSYNPNTAIKAQ